MAVMDEFKEERAALKNASLKEKWEYFLDYYKWYVIGIAAFVLFFGMLIKDIVTAKDYALYGVFLNTYAYQNEDGSVKGQAMMDEMAQRLEVDTEKYIVDIDDTLSIGGSNSLDVTGYASNEMTYTSEQKLMVYFAAGDVDYMAADATTFRQYATTETFSDLREVLSPEQQEKYDDYYYYVDMQEVRDANAAAGNGTFDTYVPREYDPLDPSTCIDPVPIAICINNSPKVMDAYYFREEIVPMGIVVNTAHLDETLMFIDYLFE